MFNVAGAAPTLAGATTTAAFNLGNTGGPWLGGMVIDAGWGYQAVAWTGAGLAVAALAATAAASGAARKARVRERERARGASAGAARRP